MRTSKNNEIKQATLTRLLSYIKPYKYHFFASALISGLFGIFSAGPVYLIQQLVDNVITSRNTTLLFPFILLFIALYIGKALCMYFSAYYLQSVGHSVVNDIRSELFEHIIYLPIPFFEKHPSGDLMSRFLNDISSLQHASSSAIRNGLRSIFEAISLLSIAFYQSFWLTSLASIVAPLIAIAIKQTGRSVKNRSRIAQKDIGQLSATLQEVLIGIKSIKAFNGEQKEISRFQDKLNGYYNSIMRCVHYESLAPALVEVIAILGSSLVLYSAVLQILSGALSPGQLTSISGAIFLSYQPIKRLIAVHAEVSYGLGAAERIFSLLDETEQGEQFSGTDMPPLTRELALENISFKFSNNEIDPYILDNISLSIKKGDRIALVGPSGSGKTTLVNLLLQFYQPNKGKITIDNQDISQYNLASIRKHIGYVGQHPFLFNDSIEANILYPERTSLKKTHKKALVQASIAAHADGFITDHPEKFNRLVGENGSLLSGGQKQRITIARALIKKPELLIFDEATSALDQYSEDHIVQAISELSPETTVIIISHRPALLTQANRVIKISHGKLEETAGIASSETMQRSVYK